MTSPLTQNLATVNMLMTALNLTKEQATTAITEALNEGDEGKTTDDSRFKEASDTFPGNFQKFLVGTNTPHPTGPTEWTSFTNSFKVYQGRITRDVEHAINPARKGRLANKANGKPKDSPTGTLKQSETFTLSNLNIFSDAPLITALSEAGFQPGTSGHWHRDITFRPPDQLDPRMGTGSATISILRTTASDKALFDLYVSGTQTLRIQGQDCQPTWHLHRADSMAEIEEDSIILEPSSIDAKIEFQFAIAMYRAAGIAESDILDNVMFQLSAAGLWHVAELHTLARGTCMANLLTAKGQGCSGFLRIGATCGGAHGQQGILSHIITNFENSTFSMDLMAIRNRNMLPSEDPGPYKTGLPLTLSLRILQQSTQREKNSVAAVTIRINYPKMLTMLRADNTEMGDGHAATEAKLLIRFRQLITYCLSPRLNPDLLQSVLDSMDVEITLFKGDIVWNQSRIILLFNRQIRVGGHTPEDLFPLKQVTLWALQIALMIGIRSNKPEEYLLHYRPLTRYETTLSGHSSYQDIPGEACTIVRVTARATGDSSNTDRTYFYPVGQSLAKGSSTGVITGQDIINDPLAALLFKTLTCRTQGNMKYEQAFGGTAVALARIPKNIRCLKDSKKTITPRKSRISIRTPDQEVGLTHSRAAARVEEYGLSPQKGTSIVSALRDIQTKLNPALRPFLTASTRNLSQRTSRQIAKQISNHCNPALIEESVCKIIRTWVDDCDSPFPNPLGPIERDLTLFNLTPTKGKTQECVDSPSHRLLLGAMSFILNLEPGLSVNSACEIYHQLVMNPIQDPLTNIRLAWAAARLMAWLLLGLCQCSNTTCSCASPLTRETLHHLEDAHTLMYCRERARSLDHATVSKQFQIDSTCFARPIACQTHPYLMVGELGFFKGYRTIHEDLTATVYFPIHSLLEILMDSNVITPLAARADWIETGPKFTLGDMISSLATPVTYGVVHGFVTQADGTVAVSSGPTLTSMHNIAQTRSSLALWAYLHWTR